MLNVFSFHPLEGPWIFFVFFSFEGGEGGEEIRLFKKGGGINKHFLPEYLPLLIVDRYFAA